MRSHRTLWITAMVALLAGGAVPLARAQQADPDPNRSPAVCGSADTPETGIQGDVAPPQGANCGLTLLSQVTGPGGSVQGAGTCGYQRGPADPATPEGPYSATNSAIRVYDLTDPERPVLTTTLATHGGSESMRARTTADRSVLVAGKGVWDIRDCAHPVFKGEIPWPSAAAMVGANIASTTQHELGLSHDARRVYAGLGFGLAQIDDLDHPETWSVKNETCEMNRQSGYPVAGAPEASSAPCDVAPQGEYPRQYSHSSDDNLEGNRWYGASQNGDGVSALEPATARVVDISDPQHIKVLDSLPEFPGHSMNWWRTTDGHEFILGANEAAPGDTCLAHEDRPTNLGTSADGYIAEVTGDDLRHASRVSLMINEPQNCQAAKDSGSNAAITEHSIYNEGKAAFAMVEFGSAGLRIFDLRDGDGISKGRLPQEVAYFNSGGGYVHSGVFHYDAARGIVLASAADGMQVLELQPQVIKALGLPKPTDPAYPRYPEGRPAHPDGAPAPAPAAPHQEGVLPD